MRNFKLFEWKHFKYDIRVDGLGIPMEHNIWKTVLDGSKSTENSVWSLKKIILRVVKSIFLIVRNAWRFICILNLDH